MCGFRTPDEIRRLLTVFSTVPSLREGFAPLLRALEIPDPASALRGFLSVLFSLPSEVKGALTEYILSADDAVQTSGTQTSVPPLPTPQGGIVAPPLPDWELMRQFARLYPNDPAILSPLYLNVFHLEPGEAIFLKAGLLHAYIHGFAV
jgi:mannose-6-phosphate isomerase